MDVCQPVHVPLNQLQRITPAVQRPEHVDADPNQPSSQQLPLLYLALQQPQQSLALISTLLQNGCEYDFIADADNLPDTALLACFEYCADNDLMLHISRLVEQGADINMVGLNGCSPLQKALQKEQLSLIQLMIQSGAELPDEIPQSWCSETTANYARRCAEDLRIRKLMMG